MPQLKHRHRVLFGGAALALLLTSLVQFLIVGVADKSMLFIPLFRLPECIMGIAVYLGSPVATPSCPHTDHVMQQRTL